jgi:hypothetical protein
VIAIPKKDLANLMFSRFATTAINSSGKYFLAGHLALQRNYFICPTISREELNAAAFLLTK